MRLLKSYRGREKGKFFIRVAYKLYVDEFLNLYIDDDYGYVDKYDDGRIFMIGDKKFDYYSDGRIFMIGDERY